MFKIENFVQMKKLSKVRKNIVFKFQSEKKIHTRNFVKYKSNKKAMKSILQGLNKTVTKVNPYSATLISSISMITTLPE